MCVLFSVYVCVVLSVSWRARPQFSHRSYEILAYSISCTCRASSQCRAMVGGAAAVPMLQLLAPGYVLLDEGMLVCLCILVLYARVLNRKKIFFE